MDKIHEKTELKPIFHRLKVFADKKEVLQLLFTFFNHFQFMDQTFHLDTQEHWKPLDIPIPSY